MGRKPTLRRRGSTATCYSEKYTPPVPFPRADVDTPSSHRRRSAGAPPALLRRSAPVAERQYFHDVWNHFSHYLGLVRQLAIHHKKKNLGKIFKDFFFLKNLAGSCKKLCKNTSEILVRKLAKSWKIMENLHAPAYEVHSTCTA